MGGLWPDQIKLETSRQCELRLYSWSHGNEYSKPGLPFKGQELADLPVMLSFHMWATLVFHSKVTFQRVKGSDTF